MVRRYRYLLRTAPLDALEAAHAEALLRLDPMIRAAILRTAQEVLGTGHQVTLDDAGKMAHLLCLGERHSPGSLLTAYDDASRQRLAQAVVSSEAVAHAWEGYDDWDGAEPQPEEQAWAEHGFNPDSGKWSRTGPSVILGPSGPGSGGGGDGGGGGGG